MLKIRDVIDSILERKEPEFTEMPNSDFFADIDIVDLMYVQAILEANIIQMVNYDAENNSAIFFFTHVLHLQNSQTPLFIAKSMLSVVETVPKSTLFLYDNI